MAVIAAAAALTTGWGAPAAPRLPKLTLPPVKTFEAACARCHGPQGSFYGEEFAHLKDADLLRLVGEMMRGPGALKPTEDDVQAMAAYHRALAKKGPFVVVTNPAEAVSSKLKKVQIETSPGARQQTEQTAKGLRIRATLAGKSTEILFPGQAWSHAAKPEAKRE